MAVIASPAIASMIKRSDGNDTKGPLDLSSVVVRDVRGGNSFRITTRQPFTNADVRLRNRKLAGFFDLLLDTNADRRIDYFAEVFYFKGRLRGVLLKRSGDIIALLKASRVSGRAVKVIVRHSKVPNKGSYDFGVLSAYLASPCTRRRPCVDLIPNRSSLIRDDFTPPKIDWNVPKYASATLTIPVSFSVKDDSFGSGVKSWTLKQKKVGTSTWVDVKSGSNPSPTVNFPGEEGATYDFRVNAVDRQGNKKTATKRVSVPYDDRNALFTYSSSTQTDNVSGAFLGTTSSVPSGGPLGGTMTFTTHFDARDICVLLGPATGSTHTTVYVNDIPTGGTINESGSTPARSLACLVGPIAGGTEVKFLVAGGVPNFVFDGVILAP